jgi:hypothetical protein
MVAVAMGLLYLHFDMIGFAVSEGQGKTADPKGHRIFQGRAPLNLDSGTGNQAHIPNPAPQFSFCTNRHNGAGLIVLHLPHFDGIHAMQSPVFMFAKMLGTPNIILSQYIYL